MERADPLPTDVPTLHAMVRDLRAELAEVKGKLDKLLAVTFGRFERGKVNGDVVRPHLLGEQFFRIRPDEQPVGYGVVMTEWGRCRFHGT